MNVTLKKSLRKLTSCVLTLAMACSLVPGAAFAAGAPNLTLVAEVTAAAGQVDDAPSAEGSADGAIYTVKLGDVVTVTIYGIGDAAYTNAKWTLTYDKTQMKYLDGADNGSIDGYVIGTDGIDEYDPQKELATYRFEVLPQGADAVAWFKLSENTSYMDTYDQAIAGDMVIVTGQDDHVNVGLKDMDVDIKNPTDPDGDPETNDPPKDPTDPSKDLPELPAGSSFDAATNTLTVPYMNASYEKYIHAFTSVEGADISYGTWTGGEGGDRMCTDVGTYTSTITATKIGYGEATCSAKIVVLPLDTTATVDSYTKGAVTLTNDVTVTVNGFIDASLTGTIEITATDDNGNVITKTIDNAAVIAGLKDGNTATTVTATLTATVAGKYDVTAKYIDGTNDNYNASGASVALADVPFIGEFVIAELPDVSEVYDGSNHTLTVPTVEGWTATMTYTDNETDGEEGRTNVGTETVTIAYTHDDGIYEPITDTVDVTVTKRLVTLTVADQTLEFGQALPAYTDATFYKYSDTSAGDNSGIVDGETIVVNYAVNPFNNGLNESSTIDGTAADDAVNSNYTITIVDGDLTIVASNHDKDPETTDPSDPTTPTDPTDKPDPAQGSYLVEVVDNTFRNAEEPDYVKTGDNGHRMIIFYTDKELYSYYTDGQGNKYPMYDVADVTDGATSNVYTYVDDAGVSFAYSTAFAHKYAVVVPAETGLSAAAYRSRVTITDNAADNAGIVTYGANVNDFGATDFNDLSTLYGVYNARESYMSNLANAKIILGSDLNGDKIVDINDITIEKIALKIGQ